MIKYDRNLWNFRFYSKNVWLEDKKVEIVDLQFYNKTGIFSRKEIVILVQKSWFHDKNNLQNFRCVYVYICVYIHVCVCVCMYLKSVQELAGNLISQLVQKV